MEVPTDRLYALGEQPRLGSFTFHFRDECWTWSPQAPAAGNELLLSNIYPEDHGAVVDRLDRARRTHRPFSSRHRILDTHNRAHHAVLIGALFYDPRGTPVGIEGYCVDVTPPGTAVRVAKPDDDQTVTRLRVRADGGHTDTDRHRVRAATWC